MPARAHVNLRRVRLLDLEIAILCVPHETLSGAARAANISLAAASQRLNALERMLGYKLFDRHRRGLTPTVRGRHMLTRCAPLLLELELLLEPGPP